MLVEYREKPAFFAYFTGNVRRISLQLRLHGGGNRIRTPDTPLVYALRCRVSATYRSLRLETRVLEKPIRVWRRDFDGYDQVVNYGTVTPITSISTFTQNSCTNGLSQCVPTPNPNSPAGSPYFIPGFCNGPNGECLPLPYPFSNQRRNQYRGPGFFDSDLSVNKNFKLTERLALGIGANLYNVFNHPNFTNPDPTLGDSTFGTITGTTAPPTGPYGSFATGLPSGRIIQFQGKLVF